MENIKENNKLISEYMYPDWVHPKDYNADVQDYLPLCGGSYSVLAHLISEDYINLNYHKSYNALIPVVKKIQNEEDMPGKELTKESDAWLEYHGMETLIVEDIEMLYKSVIRFITAKNNGNC